MCDTMNGGNAWNVCLCDVVKTCKPLHELFLLLIRHREFSAKFLGQFWLWDMFEDNNGSAEEGNRTGFRNPVV
jgi:hypothetical protein